MRAFARWRCRIWADRVEVHRREFNEAWTGMDMNTAERLLTRAMAKHVKWSKRVSS